MRKICTNKLQSKWKINIRHNLVKKEDYDDNVEKEIICGGGGGATLLETVVRLFIREEMGHLQGSLVWSLEFKEAAIDS